MKVLLDECVPAPLRRVLAEHSCSTAQSCGWSGVRNGELLALAERAGFEVFLTADQNLRYQQNLAARRLAILEVTTNDLRRSRAAVPTIVAALAELRAGEYRVVTVP